MDEPVAEVAVPVDSVADVDVDEPATVVVLASVVDGGKLDDVLFSSSPDAV